MVVVVVVVVRIIAAGCSVAGSMSLNLDRIVGSFGSNTGFFFAPLAYVESQQIAKESFTVHTSIHFTVKSILQENRNNGGHSKADAGSFRAVSETPKR